MTFTTVAFEPAGKSIPMIMIVVSIIAIIFIIIDCVILKKKEILKKLDDWLIGNGIFKKGDKKL